MSLFSNSQNAGLNSLGQPAQRIQYGPGNGYKISITELESLMSDPRVNVNGDDVLSPEEFRNLAQHCVPGAKSFFERIGSDPKLFQYIASKSMPGDPENGGSRGLTLNNLKRLALNGFISKESINSLFPNDPYFVHITKDDSRYGFQDILATPWVDETYVGDAPVTDFSLFPNLLDMSQLIDPNLIGSSVDPSQQGQNTDFSWNTLWQPGSWSNLLGSFANQPWLGPITQFFRSQT